MNKILRFFRCIIIPGFLLIPLGCSQQKKPVSEDFNQTIHTIMDNKKVLVYTKNGEGYVHENIPANVEAIRKLGREYNFKLDVSEDPAVFMEENIKQYDALIFANSNNEAFDTDEQKAVFQKYIHGLFYTHSPLFRKWSRVRRGH